MRVGFTGTRQDTTTDQFSALRRVVNDLFNVTEWHHGACIGADAEGVDVAFEYAKEAMLIAHPPEKRGLVSRQSLDLSDRVLDPLPYLDRNRAIVSDCDLLIACPAGPEERRSGTWSTIRFARKIGRKIIICWPNGTVTEEN